MTTTEALLLHQLKLFVEWFATEWGFDDLEIEFPELKTAIRAVEGNDHWWNTTRAKVEDMS